jgi:hypothetical protein
VAWEVQGSSPLFTISVGGAELVYNAEPKNTHQNRSPILKVPKSLKGKTATHAKPTKKGKP